MLQNFIKTPYALLFGVLIVSGCATVEVERAAPIQVEIPEVALPVVDPSEIMAQDYQALVQRLPEMDIEEQINELQNFNDAWPDVAGGYLNLALIYYQQQQWSSAAEQVNLALERSPRNAMAYNLKGALHRQNNEFRQARIAYEQAILADENYAPPYLNLAILYDIYFQYWKDAKEYYRKYLALNPAEEAQIKLWIADLDYRIKQFGGGS